MINASEQFKKNIHKGVAKIVNYADITLSDGTVLELTPADIMVGGCSITDKSTTGSNFSVGTAIGKTLTLRIANHNDKFSRYNFYNSTIFVYVAQEIDGEMEKIKKGKFYVNQPQTSGDIIEIKAVDSMCLFDIPYETTLGYPATLLQIVTDACSVCGVAPGFTTFDNSSFIVEQAPQQNCTFRSVLQWAAQIAGCIAHISNEDYLKFENYALPRDITAYFGGRFMTENDYEINGGNFTSYDTELIINGGNFTSYNTEDYVRNISNLTISTDDIIITGIKVIYQKEEYIAGDDDYCININNNPFTAGKLQSVAEYLRAKFYGYGFRPLSVTLKENPLLECFDGGYVTDYKGNTYLTIFNDVTYTTNSNTTAQCQAQAPTENNKTYISSTAQAIAQARAEAAQDLSEYDKAVQRMNLLAANALGFYSSEEEQSDGSVIFYMHNKPTREESTTIYKMTSDGFFVSTNGGETYDAGFDSEGNAILNILSVIGIKFNWAKGGVLSLGGEDNINGLISVYGKDNNLGLTINNNGVQIYSPTSQKTIAELNGKQLYIKTDDYTKPQGYKRYSFPTRQYTDGWSVSAFLKTNYKITLNGGELTCTPSFTWVVYTDENVNGELTIKTIPSTKYYLSESYDLSTGKLLEFVEIEFESEKTATFDIVNGKCEISCEEIMPQKIKGEEYIIVTRSMNEGFRLKEISSTHTIDKIEIYYNHNTNYKAPYVFSLPKDTSTISGSIFNVIGNNLEIGNFKLSDGRLFKEGLAQGNNYYLHTIIPTDNTVTEIYDEYVIRLFKMCSCIELQVTNVTMPSFNSSVLVANPQKPRFAYYMINPDTKEPELISGNGVYTYAKMVGSEVLVNIVFALQTDSAGKEYLKIIGKIDKGFAIHLYAVI